MEPSRPPGNGAHAAASLDRLALEFTRGVPHCRALGMQTLDIAPGSACMRLPYSEALLAQKGGRQLHTGAVSTLIDSVCGLAAFAALPEPERIATLDLRLDHLTPGVAGQDLIARADCHRLGPAVAFVRAECHQRNGDGPIAAATATFARALGRPPPGSGDDTPPLNGQRTMPATAAQTGPYAAYLGIQAEQDAHGMLAVLPFAEELVGDVRLPAIHGGVIAGLLEETGLSALRGSLRQGCPQAIDFSVDYLRAARAQSVSARARVTRLGRRIAHLQIEAWQESARKPIAVARMHCLLTASSGASD